MTLETETTTAASRMRTFLVIMMQVDPPTLMIYLRMKTQTKCDLTLMIYHPHQILKRIEKAL